MKPYKILQWGIKRSVVQFEETIYLIENNLLMNIDEMGLVE